MNLKICQDLIVKKLNSSDVFVFDFQEKKSKFPYGSLHIRFKRGETEETCVFLIKYRKIFKENSKQPVLFKPSNLKENIAHLVLKELKDLFAVSFTSEIYFSNQEIIVYNVEPTLFFSLHYSEEQFETGLSTLAKFHAKLEMYKNLNDKLYNLDDNTVTENPFNDKNFRKICSLITKYLKDIKEIHPNTILDDIKTQDIEKQLNIIWGKLKDIDESKKFLIHGNYSYPNLAFNISNTDCRMIDFSSISYNTPLFDLFQYVSSFSTKLNWNINIEKAKISYYDYLNTEMKKINIDINENFPKDEYENTFHTMLPIMKIIFYLKPICKKFEDSLSLSDNNISCLCSSYFELSEILNVLNLKAVEGNHSVLSFEDCYLVFKKLNIHKSQLISYKAKPLPGRNGFLGEHYNLVIEVGNPDQTKKNLFLKGIPQCEALQEFEQTVGSFFKETMFYSRYIPLLKDCGIDILDNIVPECYFADEYKYIILDDLKSYGYKTVSPASEISNEVILGVLKILAKLNASSIILEEITERKTGCKYRLSDTFEQELNEAFFSLAPAIESHRNAGAGGIEALTELVDFDDGLDDASFKISARKVCDEQVFFAKPSTKWRNTLCHGDFWSKNYMIQFDENRVENVMMIDFQTYRYAPPAQDLMAFIYLNATKDLREKFMNRWLDFYYKTFAENLKVYSIDINNILPRKDFDESCKLYEQFAITQCITHFQIILVPAEIINPLLEDHSKAREIFLGSRYNLVKMVWEMDEVYRRRLTEAVRELRSCLISKTK